MQPGTQPKEPHGQNRRRDNDMSNFRIILVQDSNGSGSKHQTQQEKAKDQITNRTRNDWTRNCHCRKIIVLYRKRGEE